MAIHHYIISIDTDHNEWILDAHAEQSFFPDGTILDMKRQEWLRDFDGDGVFHPDAEALTEQITEAISKLNEGLKS